MPDYKALYFKLFRAHSRAIEILTQAGQEAEELYMVSSSPVQLLAEADPDEAGNTLQKEGM